MKSKYLILTFLLAIAVVTLSFGVRKSIAAEEKTKTVSLQAPSPVGGMAIEDSF
jgi:hypothetical protein